MKIRVEKLAGVWLASCPMCAWTYHSRDLAKAHTEATYHTCQIRLGPRWMQGVTVTAGGQAPITVNARDARPGPYEWLGFGYSRPPEVWA